MRAGLLGCAVGLGMFVSQAALAADADGRFAGHGWAAARCSQLVEAARSESDGDRLRFVGWVAGFVTAANAYSDDTFDLAPLAPAEILANTIAQQCDQNPDAAVVEVAVALMRELEGQRLRSGRPILELEHEGESTRIHGEILRRTQAALSELGYYEGGVDGAYGPQTRGAITAFQEGIGVPQTGLPDQRTLLALFFNIGVDQPASEDAGGAAADDTPADDVGDAPADDAGEAESPPPDDGGDEGGGEAAPANDG